MIPTLALILMVALVMGLSQVDKATEVSENAGTDSAGPGAIIATTGDWWSEDMDCSGCHARNAESFNDPNLPAYAHAQAGYGDCVNCHDAETLKETHKNATGAPANSIPLRLPQSTCLACHGTYEKLAELTKDSTAYETPEGTYVNPHVPPSDTHEQNVECYNCHKIHRDYDLQGYCNQCHHTGDLTCYTCH